VFVRGGAVMIPAAFDVKRPLARSTVPVVAADIVSTAKKFPTTAKFTPEPLVPRTVVLGTTSVAAKALANSVLKTVAAKGFTNVMFFPPVPIIAY